MPWLALGIGLALLGIGVAASRSRAQRPSPGPSPQRLPAPSPQPSTPANGDARESANRIQDGTASAEDYENVAAEADRQGLADEAQALRERAAEAPEDEAIDAAEQAEDVATFESELASLDADERQRISVILGRTSVQTQAELQALVALAQAYAARGLERIAERVSEHAEALVVNAAASPQAPAPPPPDLPSHRPPSGFNPALARELAPAVANDVARNEYRYNRNRMMEFQRYAGIAVDGLYGGATRGALLFYGVTTPRRPLYRPTTTSPYPENLTYFATKVEGGEMTLHQALRGGES